MTKIDPSIMISVLSLLVSGIFTYWFFFQEKFGFRRERRDPIVHSLGLCICFVLYIFAGILLLQPLLHFQPIGIDQVTIYGILLGYLLVMALIFITSKSGFANRSKIKPTSASLIFLTISLAIPASILINELSAQFVRISSVFQKTTSTPMIGPLSILHILVLAPICEEFIFRGEIQSRIKAKYGNYLALIIASCLFSFFHLTIQQIPFTLMLGILCGAVVLMSGSVLLAILVHFIFNFLSVLPPDLQIMKLITLQTGSSILIRFNLYAIIASLCMFITIFLLFHMKTKKSY